MSFLDGLGSDFGFGNDTSLLPDFSSPDFLGDAAGGITADTGSAGGGTDWLGTLGGLLDAGSKIAGNLAPIWTGQATAQQQTDQLAQPTYATPQQQAAAFGLTSQQMLLFGGGALVLVLLVVALK